MFHNLLQRSWDNPLVQSAVSEPDYGALRTEKA
jgi:hypothetical protein